MAPMKPMLPLLVLCAACSPSASTGGGGASDAASARYATQTSAPAPDYAALLNKRAVQAGAWRTRDATAPVPSDAKVIGEAWLARVRERGALLGHGLTDGGPDSPVVMIDTSMTEQEFDRWVRHGGWDVPRHIRWSFVPAMALPGVSPDARDAIRVWPASISRTGPQRQALFYGRVELRDGCFFAGQSGQPTDKLAWFHAEVGLDIDPAGFFILRDRIGGQTLARLGENMSWAGPASAEIDPVAEQALRRECGSGEILIVGSPESTERFHTQYPHLRDPASPPAPPSR